MKSPISESSSLPSDFPPHIHQIYSLFVEELEGKNFHKAQGYLHSVLKYYRHRRLEVPEAIVDRYRQLLVLENEKQPIGKN